MSMSTEESKAYQRGYAAGRAKRTKDRSREFYLRQKQAFFDRAFLAALPACISAQGWTREGTPINDLPSRTKLAADFAQESLNHRKYFGKIT